MTWFVKTVKERDLPSELPKRVKLKPKAEVMSIVGVPPIKVNGEKLDWETVEGSLDAYKDVGVSHLFMWCFWSHVDYLESLEAKTEDGVVKLKMLLPNFMFIARDFLKPDPERGGEEGFKRLVRRAHDLGLKVIPQLCINAVYGDAYILREHPDWVLKSIYDDYAVFWPWATAPWGYVVNKSHPELIEFVTERLMPKWIIDWGVDGIFLDYPAVYYCDQRIYEIYKRMGISEKVRTFCKNRGLSLEECVKPVTPVKGHYSGEPLVAAMRRKVDELKASLGRDLTFGGEFVQASYLDHPEEAIEAVFKGERVEEASWLSGSLNKYFDWIWNYRFASLLLSLEEKSRYYSDHYAKALSEERETVESLELARFVNMLNIFWSGYRRLHNQLTAECYLTLLATAPGRVIWIGCHQLDSLEETYLLRAWYRRLIAIKKAYPSLIKGGLENALIEPKKPKIIAYNRWGGGEPVTVAVNASLRHETVTLKTRFKPGEVKLLDLLHGEGFSGRSDRFEIELPPFTARLLVEKNG